MKDFLKEEFVLLEEWHIIPKTLSELRIIGKWFDESKFGITIDKTFYQNLIPEYLGQPFGGRHKGNVLHNRIGREITFEQFNKYVLKKEEKTMIDYTIKGTKIPTIPINTEYRVFFWSETRSNEKISFACTDFISYGSTIFKGDTYIKAETVGYPGTGYYMFKLSDIQNLTKETMENNKKLIGYKLIKPEFKKAAEEIMQVIFSSDLEVTVPSCIANLRNALILDLWFEPIYEEEFNTGDWIFVEQAVSGAFGIHNKVGVITDEKSTDGCGTGYKVKFGERVWAIGTKAKIRKATHEEIEKASIKLPTINGYTGRVDGNLIIYGSNCAKFAINNIKDLCEDIISFNNPDEGLSNYKGGNRTITSVKLSSGVEITIEQLTKINDYLEYTLNK
jgi:hypothetical protein